MILRDHDANTAWASQADGTLESRTYICQNWRADVVALMTSAGELINQVRYDPYGVPFGIAKTDLEADGDVDGDDYTRFSTLHSGGTHPYADWNWDGTVNTSDITAYLNDQSADTGLGRGDPGYAWSHAGGALRKAYAGYEIDPVLTGSEGWESLYHVRHRVYLSTLGRWTRRNPVGYVPGERHNLALYVGNVVLTLRDPSGLPPYPSSTDAGNAQDWQPEPNPLQPEWCDCDNDYWGQPPWCDCTPPPPPLTNPDTGAICKCDNDFWGSPPWCDCGKGIGGSPIVAPPNFDFFLDCFEENDNADDCKSCCTDSLAYCTLGCAGFCLRKGLLKFAPCMGVCLVGCSTGWASCHVACEEAY